MGSQYRIQNFFARGSVASLSFAAAELLPSLVDPASCFLGRDDLLTRYAAFF